MNPVEDSYFRFLVFFYSLSFVVASNIFKGVVYGTTPPASNSERPPPYDEVQFQMYTRSHPDKFQRLEHPELTDFDARRPTVIMVHGLGNSATSHYVITLKNALLSVADVNYVAVDWSPLAAGEYVRAANNTSEAARRVAWLVDLLHTRWGADLSRLHVVGFSMGAQVAGQVSNHMRSGRLARVTALDPARPVFESWPLSKRLDASDAALVVVVHTSGGGTGVAEPLGHVDFYPNGGVAPQPACRALTFPDGCSHAIAPRYLVESVLRPDILLGLLCPSWRHFQAGLCDGGDTTPIGLFHNYTSVGSFFLRTSDSPPYGLGEEGARSRRPQGLATESGAPAVAFSRLLLLLAAATVVQ